MQNDNDNDNDDLFIYYFGFLFLLCHAVSAVYSAIFRIKFRIHTNPY